MSSWRETVSQTAQDDLDGLVAALLPFAEHRLASVGEFYPYGAVVTNDGDAGLVAGDPALGENPDSADVLANLLAGVRASAGEYRAAAFVADVRTGEGDAIRIEVEHREGIALLILVPYTRDADSRTIEVGEMAVALAVARVWVL